MDKSRKFKLLKEIPGCKVGDIFYEVELNTNIFQRTDNFYPSFTLEQILDNPYWFEEVDDYWGIKSGDIYPYGNCLAIFGKDLNFVLVGIKATSQIIVDLLQAVDLFVPGIVINNHLVWDKNELDNITTDKYSLIYRKDYKDRLGLKYVKPSGRFNINGSQYVKES